ncbi:MAG: D-alanyl-D-alanine carboxypeptidase [Pseudolabrys sp.]|nr:D-alanyl-D-alanine carboxypeptidase [Pseudolabrys sp.]
MSRAGAIFQQTLRWGALGLAALVLVTAVSTDADARNRKRKAAAPAYTPPYASLVIDVNSGSVLQATNADTQRFPASLTKIMTLYLLFEQLESGKMKLNTEMPVSLNASRQAPSKLALKPGQTIQVETAIRALVTKSANDVAVVIAEAIGGDVATFGRQMTAKARALGMNNTVYRNPHGLPDSEQITTARDQVILGRAVQDRFPQYYHYFSTRTLAFRGQTIRNHNRLLGSVAGVDGIKTGYIRASGFNVVTSVRRGNRHIVAAVFGGSTAAARDARMRSLIDNNINIASVRRTTPLIVEGWTGGRVVQVASAPPVPAADPRPAPVAAAAVPMPVPSPAPAAAPTPIAAPATAAVTPGSTDPIKPVAVRTVAVQPATVSTASLSPLPPDNRRLLPAPAGTTSSVTTVATVKNELPPPPPGAGPGILGVLPARQVSSAQVASAGGPVPVPAATAELAARPRGGWMIQVGAFDDEGAAKDRLVEAKDKAKAQLGEASPFTEKVARGPKSLFRARFAGIDKDQAETACKNLKRSDIPCMTLRNN